MRPRVHIAGSVVIMLMLALASACGGSNNLDLFGSDAGSGGASLEDGSAEPLACRDSNECPLELVCDRSKHSCVECVQHSDCAPGETCVGSSCDAGSGGAAGAGGGDAAAGAAGTSDGSGGSSGRVPNVVLFIDRSSSMASPYGTTGLDRWTAVREALLDPAGPVAQSESRIAFGLFTYTADPAQGNDRCPLIQGAAPAILNFAALRTYYVNETLLQKSETPTGEAITALRRLTNATDIVLITDGEPDTCAVRDPQCGHDSALLAVQQAYSAGIRTHVIGIGDGDGQGSSWSKLLQDLANAGSGQRVAQPSADHRAFCEPAIGAFRAQYAEVGGSAEYYRAPSEGLTALLGKMFESMSSK